MTDGFKIDPVGEEPSKKGFQIDPIDEVPTTTAPPKGPDDWMSNEQYYSSGVPGFIPTSKEAGRMAVETGTTYLGGSAGALIGRRAGPTGAAAGMRVGEAAGAYAGSLISETFDPTENPIKTASTAAAFTAGTGAVSSGATALLRKAIGKPTEAGQALIDNLVATGDVPPAGTVLDGPFIADAQSLGGSAFWVGRRIGTALENAQDVTSQNARNYIGTFQRFHDGAKIGFARAESHLRYGGLDVAKIVPVSKDAIIALQPAIEIWRREGVMSKFPADLQWLSRFNPNLPMPKQINLTVNEASALESLLFNRARDIDASPRDIATAADATKLSATMRDIAGKVQASIDKTTNDAIYNKQLSPQYRTEMVKARQLWSQWKQGELLEDILVSSSKDLTSATPRASGQSILNKLDALSRREHEIGRTLVDPQMKKNLRNYAIALKTARESAEAGQFKLAGRQGQLVGYSTLASVTAGYALGGTAGGALGGAGFILITPPALAYLFTNKQANALMLRGLKAKPGTAAAVRISREIISLLAANGWVPPERVQEQNLQDTRDPSTIPTPSSAGGLRGQAPTGGGVDPFTSAVSVLR